jgi:hypothetical protein
MNDFPYVECASDYDTQDPNIMANESIIVAKVIAYGTLAPSYIVNDTYLVPNRDWVQRRLSLGGYRLGRMLQLFFETDRATLGAVGPRRFSVREGIAWGIDGVLVIVIAVYSFLSFQSNDLGYGLSRKKFPLES